MEILYGLLVKDIYYTWILRNGLEQLLSKNTQLKKMDLLVQNGFQKTPIKVYFLPVSGLGSEDEVRLVMDLFDKEGYNPLIRPVKNLTQKVQVDFGLAMIQLINVVSHATMID